MTERIVWLYWEGAMPPYIELCIRSVRQHNDDVRLLDRDAFQRLRGDDHQLDIDCLAVNHRSDYIRAYLLRTYGGLYVDADCLVMRPFDEFFAAAEQIGFAGYRQADGYMSCNLMAARPGNAVIDDHYAQVRDTIAAGRALAWLDLASVPMEAAVRRHPEACRLWPWQQIMPVWWGHSDVLCIRASDDEHRSQFDPTVICYMLSNNTIANGAFTRGLRYLPGAVLERDRSFLGFLIRRALGLPPPDWYEVPEHLGGHENITQLDEGAFDYLVERYGVGSILDIGCGPGGMLYYARGRGLHAVGIDGDPTVARDVPGVIEHDFTLGPLDVGQFDLGWVVEFVEHVEERFIRNYMHTLRGCRYVFVTAAVPGQPGYHHVNCQSHDYWVERFAEAGFALDEEASKCARVASTMQSGFTSNTGMVFRNTNKIGRQ